MSGATIAAPTPLHVASAPSLHEVAACAGLEPDDLLANRHAPACAGVGLGFIIAEVDTRALSRAVPNEWAFRRLGPGAWSNPEPSLLLYARDGDRVRARMFAPLMGVPEDPATGSANAALAAFLLSLSDRAEHALTITQGTEMGRPSLLHATARRTPDGIRATVGGRCVPVLRGDARLDDR